jgi:hypothetical protein
MGLTLSQWREMVTALGCPERIAEHPAHSGRSRFRSGEPGCWRITIPHWHPYRLNQTRGRHWSVEHRLKERDRALIALYAQTAGVAVATGPRRVHLALTLGKGQRGGDPDAYWKGLLDSLVRLYLLIDDSPKYVVLYPVEFARGKEAETTIELYDL